MRRWILLVSFTAICGFWSSVAPAADVQAEIDALRQVEERPREVARAQQAWQTLSRVEPSRLPELLAGMDGAGPLARNWLRASVDAVAERALAEGKRLPADRLEQFLLDTAHDPRARRLAYEWLVRVDKTAADRLIPRMLNDASVELRRDAVARYVEQAESLEKQNDEQAAIDAYRKALGGARDPDQVKQIAKRLRDLRQQVDLPRHFGFLMHWHVIGPFDNTDRKGFASVYPPERELDLHASYPGKDGTVRWKTYATQDSLGMVDLNQPFGPLKEAVGYAWTGFTSSEPRDVELRLGCKNAWKVWLNGELLFARDEYHRGMTMDQYVMPATLKTGRNEILVKLCQNEEMESWTVEWQFQLRVCDSTGTAVLSTTRPE